MMASLVLMALFFLLGLSIGPLLVAMLTQMLSSGLGKSMARWSIGVGLAAVHKPVLAFNRSSDLTLKQRQFDEKHDSEYLSYGGLTSTVKRTLLDRRDSYHSFYGTPFAFVDEPFGVPVDPRDVDVGHNLRRDQEHSRYEHRIQDGNGLQESVKAVFARPVGHIGVRLNEAATLYGGSLDAKSLDKLREYYQASQAPKDNTSNLLKLMIPVAAFIAVVLMGMFASGGGPSAPAPTPGGNTTLDALTVLAASGLPRTPDDDDPDPSEDPAAGADGGDDGGDSWLPEFDLDLNWRNAAVAVIVPVLALGFALMLLLAFPQRVPLLGMGIPLGGWCVLLFGLGAALPPVIAQWFGRSLGPLGMALGKLYLIIGLMGFDRPVVDYDDGQYHVVEYHDHDFPVEPAWYRFAFSRVGVAFRNVEDNWPEGTTIEPNRVEALAESGEDDAAPMDMVRTDEIAVDSIHGLVPQAEEVESGNVYVRTDRTTGVLSEAGKDRRLLNQAIQRAKQDYGGGASPVSDKWIVGATVAAIGMGAVVLVVM